MNDYKVADITLADFGRKASTVAATEMPAYIALRRRYGREKPLERSKNIGCGPMTMKPAALIETITEHT